MEEKILRERDKRVLKFIDMKSREDPDEEQVGQISAMETKLKHLGLGEMSSEDLLMEVENVLPLVSNRFVNHLLANRLWKMMLGKDPKIISRLKVICNIIMTAEP